MMRLIYHIVVSICVPFAVPKIAQRMVEEIGKTEYNGKKQMEWIKMIAQKATILCLYEILKKYTDENHILSAEKIREKLKIIYDVDMERRAIYRNIEALRSMGIEIEGYQENREGYYLIDREFELSEIRLLCDAVAASDMIKEETGKVIIKKLIDSQSIFQGRMLQKTVFVKSEKKIISKHLFYNIDALNVAINQGCKVSVQLLQYGLDQKLVEVPQGTIVLSPYVTIWAEGNYYILAKKENSEQLEHFRVDHMKDIVILERGVDMIFGGLNPGQYAKQYIFQNGEMKEKYEIECGLDLWQKIAEKFGNDAMISRKNYESMTVRISAIPSVMRAWVMAHINQCEVVSPKHFRDEIQMTIMEAYKQYCM